MEKRLLSGIIHSRELFDELLSYTDGAGFSDQGEIIFKAISDYYGKDGAALSVDREILINKIKSGLSNPKHAELFTNIINDLEPVSIPNVREEFLSIKKEEVSMSLSSSLLGNKDEVTRKLIGEWQSIDDGLLVSEEEEEEYTGISIQESMENLSRDNLITLYPSSLNDRCDGGATKGDHIIISGRVEDGKSLTAINMVCGMANEGHRVLYIGNEEDRTRMIPRFQSNFTKMNKEELRQFSDSAQERLNKTGYENLMLVMVPAGTLHQIEQLVIKHKPDVVVLDQLRNIDVGIEDGPKQLEKAAKGARRLMKRHHYLGISVTQSNNDEARINKLVGEMSDIDSSKVGIPSTGDLIIMLGSNEEFRQTNRRMVSVVKNKLSGWHGFFPIKINPTISTVENLG